MQKSEFLKLLASRAGGEISRWRWWTNFSPEEILKIERSPWRREETEHQIISYLREHRGSYKRRDQIHGSIPGYSMREMDNALRRLERAGAVRIAKVGKGCFAEKRFAVGVDDDNNS